MLKSLISKLFKKEEAQEPVYQYKLERLERHIKVERFLGEELYDISFILIKSLPKRMQATLSSDNGVYSYFTLAGIADFHFVSPEAENEFMRQLETSLR